MKRAAGGEHLALRRDASARKSTASSSFSDSFAALLGAIVYKQKQLRSGAERVALSLGRVPKRRMTSALDKLAKGDFLKKLWAKDPSPWSSDPQAAEIIKHALGWLDIPQQTAGRRHRPGFVRARDRARIRSRRRARHGRKFARAGHSGRHVRTDGRVPATSRARFDRSAADRKSSTKRSTSITRSSSSRARAARRPSPTRTSRITTTR